jgi:4-hydroxy-tetrahydrodipicolinate synthase
MNETWNGVFPAITTPFAEDGQVDLAFLRKHVAWMAGHGCRGMVPLGSLGEANTLTFEEKIQILEACLEAVDGSIPIVAGIAGLSTSESVALARAAERVGCAGLMVLPPYVYRGDWRESEAYFSAVITATPLPCIHYNNPIAYGTDTSPEQIAQLAAHSNLRAVKESSGDIRRIAGLRALIGDRLTLFTGIDDMILEGMSMGVTGWIAGLVNAFPAESVRLFDLMASGRQAEAFELYEWFLPLLRLDTGPKFVQMIKLAQEEVGYGSARVRAPRLELEGAELERTLGIIRAQLAIPVPGGATGTLHPATSAL